MIPITDEGELRMDLVDSLLTDRTKIVAVVHVSNSLGTINPITTIVEKAHARGIPVLVDGAQAVAHMPVDVQALGCDFYAMSGHKLFGPTGIGVLWGRLPLLETMPPYQGGGDMISAVTFKKTTYNVVPNKFEAGTPNIAGSVGLGAAIDYLNGIDFAAMQAYEDELLAYGTKALTAVPGIRMVGTASKKASILSFVMEDVHPHDIGTILDQEGVAIRTGHHCTQPLMERLCVPATARASLALYNTKEEIDALVGALARVREIFALMDLRELYQEVILDHNKRPRNFRVPDPVNRKAEGYNPLCGDKITVFLYVEGDMIKDLAFQGTGCAISKASASMMTDELKGKTLREADAFFEKFHTMLTAPATSEVEMDALGKLAVLSGVREYPMRVKCASLAWHTLKAAMKAEHEVVSTE